MLFARSLSSAALVTLCAAAWGQTPIEFIYTAEDSVGARLAYAVKEKLLSSKSLALSNNTGSRFQARLVTLDGDGRSSQSSNYTIYGVVFTFRFDAEPVPWYLNNFIGTCGVNRIENCADSIVARMSKEVDDIAKASTKGKE